MVIAIVDSITTHATMAALHNEISDTNMLLFSLLNLSCQAHTGGGCCGSGDRPIFHLDLILGWREHP